MNIDTLYSSSNQVRNLEIICSSNQYLTPLGLKLMNHLRVYGSANMMYTVSLAKLADIPVSGYWRFATGAENRKHFMPGLKYYIQAGTEKIKSTVSYFHMFRTMYDFAVFTCSFASIWKKNV